MNVPVVVAAKNEARAIARTLEALVAARAHAEARLPMRFDLVVVVDDSTDATASIARAFDRVAVLESHGGKVEAQRAGLRHQTTSHGSPPFAVFCDADVVPSAEALFELASLLRDEASVQVATCRLRPLPPVRRTPLARALHTYNRRRGFSSQRTWFNGKLFAIRAWSIPEPASFPRREHDPFYEWERGIVAEDIYLSRIVVRDHGAAAIAETPRGEVAFRAPETWRGMNRYYRRMRRELERVDTLCPDTVEAHRAHGSRQQDLLAAATWTERMHHTLFRAALGLCRAAYVTERAWVQRVTRTPRTYWPAIGETKA